MPRRIGKPQKWTDRGIKELAEVREVDVESARAWWERFVPKRYKALLDAEPEIPGGGE